MKNLKKIFQHPLIQKYQFFFLPGIILFITLFLLVLIIVPQLQTIFDNSKQLSVISEKNKLLKQKISFLEKIDATEYKDSITTALIALPEDKDISGIIGQVLYSVRKNNLSLEELSFSSSTGSLGKAKSFQMRLGIAGDMVSIKNFINQTQNNPRLIKIISLDLSGSRGNAKLQSTVDVDVFYQALPTSIGEIESNISSISPKDLELLTLVKNNIQSVPTVNPATITGAQGKADPFQ